MPAPENISGDFNVSRKHTFFAYNLNSLSKTRFISVLRLVYESGIDKNSYLIYKMFTIQWNFDSYDEPKCNVIFYFYYFLVSISLQFDNNGCHTQLLFIDKIIELSTFCSRVQLHQFSFNQLQRIRNYYPNLTHFQC